MPEPSSRKAREPSVHTAQKGAETAQRGFTLMRVVEIVVALAALVGIAFGVRVWLESEVAKTVQKELSSDATLRRIATQAQPMLIFDENGGIISDSGGLAYIDHIVIEQRNGAFPTKLLVKPKQFLSQPPLLSTIDGIVLDYETRRREGLDWEFSIKQFLIQSPMNDGTKCRFRLEILRNP